jgi:inorganic triphosphatase YgiF
MSVEKELNLSLSPRVASQLAKHPLLTDVTPVRQRVQNTYYDTPDQRLRHERVVVRYGKTGSTWLSSVRRVPLHESGYPGNAGWESVAALGDLDFSHVEDSSLRQWLESLREDLQPAFTTSFTRSAWLLEPREGVRIELALDRGWIEAQGRRQAICEVGLELLEGRSSDLFSAAGELQTGLALHPEAASRFQRGYRVLSDELLQPVKALPIETRGEMTAVAAFRQIALACLKHLQSNEQGLHASDNPEFVHQARVAIRRLRSAIRIWRPHLPQELAVTFDPLWQALARLLGETRNWDVFRAETLPAVVAACPAGVEVGRLTQHAQRRCAINREAARNRLKSADYSRLLLEFTAAVLALPEDDPRCLETFAPRCLDKRARKVWQLAAGALEGDAAARHRLRVAYKRLRYALEFFAPLFPGELLRNYHQAASGLQEILGRLNDLAVAAELTEEALPGGQGTAVRRWLEAQSESLLPDLGGLLNDFHKQLVPWSRSP